MIVTETPFKHVPLLSLCVCVISGRNLTQRHLDNVTAILSSLLPHNGHPLHQIWRLSARRDVPYSHMITSFFTTLAATTSSGREFN